MREYKIFLKCLLSLNIVLVLVVAFMGYKQEQDVDTVEVSGKVQSEKAIPMGNTVGIYINTKGILVIDTGEVTGMDGKNSAPAKNKLMQGDYIVGLNGETMKTKKQLVECITNCEGETLVFDVIRNEKPIAVEVEPVQSDVNVYKIGIWIKDDLQGLGTITYLTGDSFGALGHSVNDSDTGELLSVSGGEIYEADIFGVEKGVVGTPGEIEGMIAYQTENVVGRIEDNRLYGVFGEVTDEFAKQVNSSEAIELASEEEVKIGDAQIQSYVDGEKKRYDIKITNIHENENGDPEMEIEITDDALIELTGGIVQGMSGSPIIQEDKLVGAVTHVLVDDPTKGYGIFIENMLEH
ncbi:MAG: SpoIVB peptidase [Lachnospiraceae bacterium]|nr:SpoIVB peptidase [Lachnospiraceae bacterium]